MTAVLVVAFIVLLVLVDIRSTTQRRIAELPLAYRAAASKPCEICGARPFLDACSERLHGEWRA